MKITRQNLRTIFLANQVRRGFGVRVRSFLLSIFHALAFTMYPVLFLWDRNPLQARLSDVGVTLGAAIVGALLMLVIAHAVVPSFERAALIVTGVVIATIGYGPLAGIFVGSEQRPGLSLTRLEFGVEELWVLGVVMLALLLTVAVIARLHPHRRHTFTSYANILASVLIVIPLGGAGIHGLQEHFTGRLNSAAVLPITPVRPDAQISRPDIYFIILDAYGRGDVLKDNFEFDNGWFLNFLKAQGFYVAENSRSNYPVTILSLASTLNANFLPSIVSPWNPNSTDDRPVIRAVKDNSLVQTLRRAGYQIVTLSSGYFPTELDDPDLVYEGGRLNGFGAFALGYLQWPGVRSWVSNSLHRAHRQMLLGNLSSLPRTVEAPGPKFVFAHIVAPHPPFVFTSGGDFVPPQKVYSAGDGDHFGSREAYQQAYADQLAFVSRKIQEAVLEILALSDPKPVIIIQGDHGPGMHTNFRSRDGTDYFERFANLNAFYFPDGDYSFLYPGITSVNTFRVVLNKYFGQSLPLLPDRSFYSGLQKLYDLKDVTDLASKRSSEQIAQGQRSPQR